MLVALLLSTCVAAAGDALPIVPGPPFEVTLDVDDPVRRFRWIADADGHVVIWATSETLNPVLSATQRGGEALSDDDGGGKPAACLILPTDRDVEWTFELSAAGAPTSGSATMRLVSMPETEITRAAATHAVEGSKRVESLDPAGDLDAARAEIAQLVATLTATAGFKTSRDIAEAAATLRVVSARIAASAETLALDTLIRNQRELTLPETHPALQEARHNLGVTSYWLRDIAAAHALFEAVVATRTRTLDADDSDLQATRGMLALTMKALGDLQGARAMQEQVLEARTRTLPPDDEDVQVARANLAITLNALGDLRGARALHEQVVEVRERTLPDDHPDVLRARFNLAIVMSKLGDLRGACAIQRHALGVYARMLPDDHRTVQAARAALGTTLIGLREPHEARALFEKILAVASSRLPADHPDVLRARANLAGAMFSLGDAAGARPLFESVLEAYSKQLPADHSDVIRTRHNLASVIVALGHHAEGAALSRSVIASYEASQTADHFGIPSARMNLANALTGLGEFEEARALAAAVNVAYSNTLPDYHPELRTVRSFLAQAAFCLDDVSAASHLLEQVVDTRDGTLADDDRTLTHPRIVLLWASAMLGDSSRVIELARVLQAADRSSFSGLLSSRSPREAAAAAVRYLDSASCLAAIATGSRTLTPDPSYDAAALASLEAARSVEARSAFIARRGADVTGLRAAIVEKSAEVADFAAARGRRDQYIAMLHAKDRAERECVAAMTRDPAIARVLEFPEPTALAAAFPAMATAVFFSRWDRVVFDVPKPSQMQRRAQLSAFVLARSGAVTRVDLESADVVEAAVNAWRDSIVPRDRGAAPSRAAEEPIAAGELLRRMIFDPLLKTLGDAKHLVIVLDAPLHAIPLDALPYRDGRLGDAFRLEVRSCLSELGFGASEPGDGSLVAFGGIDYFRARETPIAMLRGSPSERGFAPLPFTRDEVATIGALFETAFPEDTAFVLRMKTDATRDALVEDARQARFLHIATHGFFAPESIASTADRRTAANVAAATFADFGTEVRGLSPMALCGIALAGANAEPDELGRVPGIVTAEVLSALDLTRCELAVLSACDTNVGIVRAGQGIASMQTALHSAGARSVITSLWKVPDAATQELMVDFYRRIWIENEPKWQALWNAKKRMRDATEPDGSQTYALSDWAGWVLTGEQD